ncbi:CubicO group peptidase (beta-lactamase class C family) [Paenibacillus shirakamiensis]|uniref:CubicO group peptidase (Beta-lactamase class C family) n=1 Tax=Paenibacillus shirakamiensis TaxID=1265935 RepID=A0ABS4JIW5_9BACL|nr:serine hydrolase [Paenibacillus shirakamiensis]MBP2001645.1 CubicO group peptidase (beta-lactamase class C family) [Paenibacillus shirakamiensis]
MKHLTPILTSSSISFPYFSIRDPEHTGVSSAKILEAHQAIERSYPNMHSFLVIKDNQLIFERYYNQYHAASLHDLRSATKSFISALIGIAVQRGDLPGLEVPVWDKIQKFAPHREDLLWHRITLRHLLTMTSGLYWQTGPKLGERFLHRFEQSRSWMKFILRLPIMEDQLGSFLYRSVDSHLLSMIITEYTGQSAFSYASDHLFTPLDIQNAAWSASPEGHTMGHIGLRLTSRDMAKFGLLYLNHGIWNKSQILDSKWVHNSFTSYSEDFHGFGKYGFQWWNSKEDGVPFSYAHGHGGQQIIVIPSYKAVVIFTSESQVRRWKNPRLLLREFILPALR